MSSDFESGGLRPPDAPVLGPRPVYRPDVDAASERVFGRPDGVTGSFTTSDAPAPGRPAPAVRPPDPILAEAFGRPAHATESIQRDPAAGLDTETEANPADPWRDPNAGAHLGPPAVPREEVAVAPPGAQTRCARVLFGSRVAPKALLALAGVALLIGLLGGLVGGSPRRRGRT